MTISEKAAYLKGLMDGLELDTEKAEGKMISAIVELLGDVTKRLSDVEETTISICDELDEIEEDLDVLFGEELEDDDEDEMLYDVECPNCHEVICVDEEVLMNGDIDCPNCGEKLEFELTECEDDCDCCECDGECEDKE